MESAASSALREAFVLRVLLFGTGEYYQSYKEWFCQTDVVGLLDNDRAKQGGMLDGHLIYSPEDGVKLPFDQVYLLSVYQNEMKEQLRKLGVPEEKIYSRDDIKEGLGKFFPRRDVMFFRPGQAVRTIVPQFSHPPVALISYDMEDTTGASVALFQAAKILRQNGQEILFVSLTDGPMRERLLQMDISILVDPSLRVVTLDSISWAAQCALVFVNTNQFYVLMRGHAIDRPILWWLHDSEMLYEGKDCDSLNDVPQGDVAVYPVGKLAREAFARHCPHWTMGEDLLYGIEDFSTERIRKKERHEKKIFALIGEIYYRKAQEVFLQAIEQLSAEERSQCEFWLIGVSQTAYGEQILAKAQKTNDIKYLGVFDHAALAEIYGKLDVLVCPSRSDTMPIVATEAMMCSRPCIVSDHTGTAAYIRPRKNGLVCRAGDASDLTDCMRWMLQHQEKWGAMGQQARKTYEEHFSLRAFEENLLRVIQENLP